MSLDMPEKAKEAFFEQLDAFEDSLGAEDEDLSDNARRQSRAFLAQATMRKNPSKSAQAEAPTVPHTGSTIASNLAHDRATQQVHGPSPATGTTPAFIQATPPVPDENRQASRPRIPISNSFVQDTPLQGPRASTFPNLHRSVTIPPSGHTRSDTLATAVMADMRGSNRKRKAMGKDKSDFAKEEQVLRGFRLAYIPKARISLRKLRMERAETYGAIVTNQVTDATHIIVDKGLTYEDIKKEISPFSGTSTAVIFNDEWPLDCIKEGRVLPHYPKYRVKGIPSDAPEVSHKDQKQPAPAGSNQSLELKPPHNDPRRWDYVSPVTSSQTTASPLSFLGQRRSSGSVATTRLASQGAPSSTGTHQRVLRSTEGSQDHNSARHELSDLDDELSQIILQTRDQSRDVPHLDDEDTHLSGGEGDFHDDCGTDDGKLTKKPKLDGKSVAKKLDAAEFYACNRGGIQGQTTDDNNPNAPTIRKLQEMLDIYTQTNDHWRTRAYTNIISILSKTKDRKITTAKEAKELPGFGPRLADKLEEIITTNNLERLQYAQKDPVNQIKSLFLGIYGVGTSTAEKWIAQGYRTLEDLVKKAHLSESQRIGIEHYDDINSRIPHAEVTKLGEFVIAEAIQVDKEAELLIGGSYRRGADDSGDIDFIITKKGTTSSNDLLPFLGKLISNLTKQGFLTAALATHKSNKDGSTWHGCCVLPRTRGFNDDENYRPVWRRIDFLLVPETEYGAALIYFTGNDLFNRSIRLLASRKKMRLNQRGLYKDVFRDVAGNKIGEGELVEGRDERRIFEVLGVKWREPHERWC